MLCSFALVFKVTLIRNTIHMVTCSKQVLCSDTSVFTDDPMSDCHCVVIFLPNMAWKNYLQSGQTIINYFCKKIV